MARLTEVAIRRATLIERLESLADRAQLTELFELGQALRELDDPDRGAAVADAVRATALRLAELLPVSERNQALAFARHQRTEEVALVLPEWAARVGQALERANPQEAAPQDRPRHSPPAPFGSPQLLEQIAQELEAPTGALDEAGKRLHRMELDLDAERAAASVAAAAESLRVLLNDLLDLASLGDGRFAAARIEFDVRASLVAALDGLRPRAERRNTVIIVDIEDGVPELAIGDPGRLRQVLPTLAGNALDAGQGGEVRVRVTATRREGGVMLHVAVRGRDGRHFEAAAARGRRAVEALTPAEDQAKLGARRDSGAWVWRGGARTGLGLAIARQLVEQMHGRTWVGSSEDGGSEIHFEVSLGGAEMRRLPGGLQSGPLDLRLLVLAPADEPIDGLLEELEALGALVLPCAAIATANARLRETEINALIIVGSFATRHAARFVEEAARLGGEASPAKMLLTRTGHRGDAARCRALGIGAYLSIPAAARDLCDGLRVLCGRATTRQMVGSQRLTQSDRGALVTRHFLRESRRQLRVAVISRVPSDLASRLQRLGHEVIEGGPLHEVDLLLIDASGLGVDGIAFAADALGAVSNQQRPGVLVVLDEAAGALGLPPGLPADEIATAPVSDEVLMRAMPRLRAGHVELDAPPPASLDLRQLAERLGADRMVAREALRAAYSGLPESLAWVSDAIGSGDLQRAAREGRVLASTLTQLGAKAAATTCSALVSVCRAGDHSRASDHLRALEIRVAAVVASVRQTLDSEDALRQHAGPRRTTPL